MPVLTGKAITAEAEKLPFQRKEWFCCLITPMRILAMLELPVSDPAKFMADCPQSFGPKAIFGPEVIPAAMLAGPLGATVLAYLKTHLADVGPSPRDPTAYLEKNIEKRGSKLQVTEVQGAHFPPLVPSFVDVSHNAGYGKCRTCAACTKRCKPLIIRKFHVKHRARVPILQTRAPTL